MTNHDVIVHDSDELASRAEILLVRMCGVSPPPALVNPLLDHMFAAIKSSTVRLSPIPPLRPTHLNMGSPGVCD